VWVDASHDESAGQLAAAQIIAARIAPITDRRGDPRRAGRSPGGRFAWLNNPIREAS